MSSITRSLDHRYTYDGQTYPGVTGILKILDKSGPLDVLGVTADGGGGSRAPQDDTER